MQIDFIQSKLEKKCIEHRYDGNIEKTISIISTAKVIIGSRFHSTVLGVSLGIPVIPIAYSEKTKNTLDSIGYKTNIINIKDIKEAEIDLQKEITDSIDNRNSYNDTLMHIKKHAENHFKKLERFI